MRQLLEVGAISFLAAFSAPAILIFFIYFNAKKQFR